jgi:hypothetical protein
MKKVLSALILLLIPIISTSQSLNELKMIKNVNDFKKVMIENNFQNYIYKSEKDKLKDIKEVVVYKKDEDEKGEGLKFAMYYDNVIGEKRDLVFNWILTFKKTRF